MSSLYTRLGDEMIVKNENSIATSKSARENLGSYCKKCFFIQTLQDNTTVIAQANHWNVLLITEK